MRVAMVAGPYLPVPPVKYGGTEQVIHHLIKGLIQAGHEPILLASADSKVDCEIIPITDKAIYFPKTVADRKAHKALADGIIANTSRKLRALLPRVDIVHSNGFDLKQFSSFPSLTTLHNPIDYDNLEYYLARKDLRYVSISKNQQLTFPELNYVSTIYHGEDPADFPIVRRPDNYVCFLGRMDRCKNPHQAIQLALHLGIKIKVAGKIDHDGADYFEQEVKPLLKHPLVEWLGELGFEDKVQLISNAKCNLHPTNFREPFGLTVMEAAYSGTPTLAIKRGAMPELIEHGKTGMLVEDFIEGYYQLQKCFSMDRNYIAASSRAKFNYQKMTRQYISAYKQVLKDF